MTEMLVSCQIQVSTFHHITFNYDHCSLSSMHADLIALALVCVHVCIKVKIHAQSLCIVTISSIRYCTCMQVCFQLFLYACYFAEVQIIIVL